MKVLVLGSGVIGVTTAYQLALAGHDVTVLDRQATAGLETSFANAGEVSPGYSAPWAGPGVPLKAIKWLLMNHPPLVIRTSRTLLDVNLLRWGATLLRNCTAARYELNKSRMVRLAEYSRDCLQTLRVQTHIAYDERTKGTLQLFRTQAQLDGTGADIDVLKRYGVAFELLDREGCVHHEPALEQVKHKFVGGLRLPGDETGDCFKFTQNMAALAVKLGVVFRYGITIDRLMGNAHQLDGVATSAGVLRADAYLVALGSYSPLLLKSVGLRLPVYPVKGYSITLPLSTQATHPGSAPESTVMDETHKVAITRLGDRIRAGGTAELGGYSLKLHPAPCQTLTHVVNDLFPQGGDMTHAEFWCGLRPMTPDGTPILGGTPLKNLYLATGHGTLGWTMAAGTARVMADLISGKAPEIGMEGLTLRRYQSI
jgi:D-amino-acid dehydrogenase